VKYEPVGRIKSNHVRVKNTIDIKEFMKMIYRENVLFAVIDYLYGLEPVKNVLNVADARTIGRDAFLKLREEDKEVPVYILDGSHGYDFTEKEKLYALNDEAFPKEERIPSDKLLALLHELGCDAWAFYEGVFVGFAVLLSDRALQVAYLSYFAIDGAYRSKGCGGAALAKLSEVYEDCQIVLDMERMDETAENYGQRLRRLAFYERNGYRSAGVGFQYFKMDLEIMCNRGRFREQEFRCLIDRIKLPGFVPRLYSLESGKTDFR